MKIDPRTAFVCGCGRTHALQTDAIVIEEGAADRLSAYIRDRGFSLVYTVSDANTFEAAGRLVSEKLDRAGIAHRDYVLPDSDLVPDEYAVGRILAHIPREADLVLAVGSGTLNDLCKLISSRVRLPYIIFASAPSMDGFLSSGAAVVADHMKTTLEAQVPLALFADLDVLREAPMDLITAGLGDVLGKYTCLLDWKLSHLVKGEYYCDMVADMVREALEIAAGSGEGIAERDPEAIRAVMSALVLCGIGMAYTGNSRPASGCEHHMSHYWEMKFQMDGKKAIPHGTKVGVGMVLAVRLYRMLLEEEPDFEAALKRQPDPAVWEARVREAFGDAARGVLALEERVHKNDLEERNRRILFYRDHWDELRVLIDKSLPSVEEAEKVLSDLGAPIRPARLGISEKETRDAVTMAREVRDRFTLLQILWDLGLLYSFADRVCREYREE